MNDKRTFLLKYCCTEPELAKRIRSGKDVAMPCNCGHEWCRGWAVVHNTPCGVRLHIDRTLAHLGHESRMSFDEKIHRIPRLPRPQCLY